MLRLLFPGLTAQPQRGAELFAAVTGKARERHWYVEGQVPDTIDGRFRLLATLLALVTVRLETAGDVGDAISVALTERFIEVMEAEHRELGLGDPALGRKVRALVGALARRVKLWRSAAAEGTAWRDAAKDSAYADAEPPGLAHTAEALAAWWVALQATDVSALKEGRVG